MQSFNAVEKHSSCPSHQQELSSAFSLTVLRDASPRDNLSLLSFIHTLTHTQTHTNEHTYPHKPILSILNVRDTEFISGFHVFSLLMSAQSLASIYPLLPTSSLSLSHLDVVERVKTARLRRSTSHAQPSVQRVLGGPVQRVVLRERQHHCISLREKTGDF